ncbi:DEAD/DEAH box helicase [Pseudomonas sp. PIC25]|uniref:ligase-associated DNA damage response endonuclease PdeM n=1 Tax=Pseudomonas sp. PIC25 TaxID=1958773 RepID=UPI000BABD87B|nr:ligase-associated DNA damage response endonuclease PdeM [Pseudomonas sp. PIC25]PAU64520.1 DEAD/DEAH box helicase [Pseudomonas sp. PIC25]
MSSHHVLPLAGTELWLLGEKAVYWPEHRTLLVADIHFGKAAAYRRLGQPVPQGTTSNNLRRLDALLDRHACSRLVFLGDFLHAPESHAPATLARLGEWREHHAALPMILVRGNHDRRAGDPPAALNIEVLGEPSYLGPFALRHEPIREAGHVVLAGHLHPAFRLAGKGQQSLRLPCFSVEDGLLLLPAFGDFTGGMELPAAPGRRVFVVADGEIWPV